MSRTRAAAPDVARNAAQIPSAPLPTVEQDYFERRFDADFSRVRVHTGPEAAALAGSMGAKAFAAGDHVVFGEDRFAPGTTPGRTLLAHELAHVAQQQRGAEGVPQSAAAAEGRAQAAATTATAGGGVAETALGAAGPGVQCDNDEKPPQPGGTPTTLPPLMPPLQLDPIDWAAMREPFWKRGMPFGPRDMNSVQSEWNRSGKMLDLFGIDDRFKLGFITKDWIRNLGLAKQLEDMNARDNPNSQDRMNRDWSNAHPDAFQTPIFPYSWHF
jgi:hypothetical protein